MLNNGDSTLQKVYKDTQKGSLNCPPSEGLFNCTIKHNNTYD